MLFNHHKSNLNCCMSSSNKMARSWNLHEFDGGTYLFGYGAQIKFLLIPLSVFTNLPVLCKWDNLGEDNITFNHLQFQDTCMYLLNLVGLVKTFATLQASFDCTLLRDWNNSKLTFKVHITTHIECNVYV